MAIDIVKIFPPIGIARLGNSTDDFFIGPEIPGDYYSGPYRDSNFRIKRQAARFRLFGYQAGSSQPPTEITLDNADEINWSVELANTKAEAEVFGKGINDPPHPNLRRNEKVKDNRSSLMIKPDSWTLTITPSKPDAESHVFTGSFLSKKGIVLGEMRIEEPGRLIVLGGLGISDSKDPVTGEKVSLGNFSHGGGFADNDGWYDDVSDGPINALVRMKGSDKYIKASTAWVICAPPKFAPQIQHIITLYDTLLQVAIDRSDLRKQLDPVVVPSDIPSFTKEIYPLLIRAINMKWVISTADAMHSHIRQILYGAYGPVGSRDQRSPIFYRLRDPSTKSDVASVGQDMPKIWSDIYKVDDGASITEPLKFSQYHAMDQWQKDIFKNDWPQGPSAAADTAITPEGLTRAALENCVGGAFYPGIETSFNIRDKYAFVEPFRLDASQLSPGDLTKQMCVPWQADFFDCQTDDRNMEGTSLDWWPAQRPVHVFPVDQPENAPPVEWTRDIIINSEDMIHSWHKLGFIVKQGGDRYVETERNG